MNISDTLRKQKNALQSFNVDLNLEQAGIHFRAGLTQEFRNANLTALLTPCFSGINDKLE
jgi:hypothetical protein